MVVPNSYLLLLQLLLDEFIAMSHTVMLIRTPPRTGSGGCDKRGMHPTGRTGGAQGLGTKNQYARTLLALLSGTTNKACAAGRARVHDP
jgi:hypothetical protein